MTCKTSENKALQELKKILKICSFSKSVNYKMKDAKRKKYNPAFKAKVALELARELRTVNEVAEEYGVHPNMITKWWKKQLKDGLLDIFSNGNRLKNKEKKKLIASLYQKIGQLEVELDLKKSHQCSVFEKQELIETGHPLISVSGQCELIGISRCCYYYQTPHEVYYQALRGAFAT